MFKERKMSIRRGITLGASFGYLFSLMILFSFELKSAFQTCMCGTIIGIIIGLIINFLYNYDFNKDL